MNGRLPRCHFIPQPQQPLAPAPGILPDQAVIGATLVDTNRGLTEMIITLPAAVEAVVTYYEENLPLRGYEITSSDGTDGAWVIEFSGEGIDGVISIKAGGSGLSSATVRLTNS